MAFSEKTTLLWSLSLLIFVFGITYSDKVDLSTNDSYSEGSSVEAITKIDEVLSGKIVESNPETCGSIGVCENGGSCVNEDGKNHCQCNEGTKGDRCEIVEECEKDPSICGNEQDAKCIYDVLMESAECLCNNASKGFDSYKKKCRVPCKKDKDCSQGIRCRKTLDDEQRFCRCPFGIGGDRCLEEIDECKAIGFDCGTNPNVTCLEEKKGKPVCYCNGSSSYAFNYEIKDCVECNCQNNNLGCKFLPGGEKVCFCETGYYYEDGRCKACECGSGSYGCELKNGTKVCRCSYRYVQLNTTCESCYCGIRGICSFENGKKVCSCEPDSLPLNGTCKKKCSPFSSDSCKNGGLCKDDVCQCLPGTKGDRCEIIDGCEYFWEVERKCDYAEGMGCAYNETSQTSYCKCKKEGYFLDKYFGRCIACDCGSHGKCSFEGGAKICDCEEGYAEQPRDMYKESRCKPCSCGHNSTKCTFPSSSTKACECDEGYADRLGECTECNCGPSLDCYFNSHGEKVCLCYLTSKVKNGRCYPCYCGWNGECELNEYNKPICSCEKGYGDQNGTCTKCDCSLDGQAVNCNFLGGIQKCSCPEGYEERNKTFCTDIDECEVEYVCPNGTECNNTIGGYECNCKKGFKPFISKPNTKRYGCKDIDECKELNACPYNDTTVCINTYGSYYCSCKNGYHNKFSSSSSIETSGCEKDKEGWKIGFIILLVAFIIFAVGLVVIIYRRRRNN